MLPLWVHTAGEPELPCGRVRASQATNDACTHLDVIGTSHNGIKRHLPKGMEYLRAGSKALLGVERAVQAVGDESTSRTRVLHLVFDEHKVQQVLEMHLHPRGTYVEPLISAARPRNDPALDASPRSVPCSIARRAGSCIYPQICEGAYAGEEGR